MKLNGIHLNNHPVLKNLSLDFINKKTNKPYNVVVFVGENGCGKTTLLNQILNYSNSPYIINKQSFPRGIIPNDVFHALYIRQNTMYSLSQNEISKRIDGKSTPFPLNLNEDLVGGKNLFNLRTTNMISTPNLGKEEIAKFGDQFISDCYMKNKISNISCGGYALKLIDGKKPRNRFN